MHKPRNASALAAAVPNKSCVTRSAAALEAPVPTVLIADDDADHRELLTLALRRNGHTVVAVEDAARGMAVLRAGGIDVALIDVRMPGESGIEMCRRLRGDPRTAVLPVMLISADVNDQRILAGLHAGADDYVTKPFHRGELCARLNNLLLRRPATPVRVATASSAALLAARHAFRPAPELTQTERRESRTA